MRAAVAVLVLAAVVAVVVLVARSGDEPYRVRAIFDNAGFVIPGEDVKVAGVKVGAIHAVEVTPDFKAAVVLQIDAPGYRDFRADASCIVRPQSLIGERFVECTPTRKRAVGAEPPRALAAIADGPNEGQRLLPVQNTQKSVDLDLLNNIMRRPYAERLSLILSELGTGLAGRGEDLDGVIRRANPALRELDGVLRVLARQNADLEALAVAGDQVMAPLARERRRVSSSIENMGEVAAATAERRDDLEAGLQRLPRFLAELRPTMTRLGALADEMTPVVTDLGDVAPELNRLLLELGPFARAGIPAFDSLGEAAKTGRPAIERSLPLIRDVRVLAREARPTGRTLAALLTSFQRGEGIERAMDYLFYQATAVNGFDGLGHYLRASLSVNQCTTYATQPVAGCSANFLERSSASSATATTAPGADRQPRDPVLAATGRALAGAPPAQSEPMLDYLFGAPE